MQGFYRRAEALKHALLCRYMQHPGLTFANVISDLRQCHQIKPNLKALSEAIILAVDYGKYGLSNVIAFLFLEIQLVNISCSLQVGSLASTTFVCTLGREQQYFPNNQLSAAAWLTPPSWPRCWLATESLLLPETPWLEPPSWRRRWLAAESLSLLADPEGVVYRTAM